MNWKNLFSWDALKRSFDWTPVSVRPPRARYMYYKDIGKMLLGYEVEVEYLYHGNQKRLFAIDEEKLCLISRRRALSNAVAFYKDMKFKVREYKKGQKNEHKF